MAGTPFEIDPASPAPFAIPLVALRSIYYPEVNASVVPQLWLLTGIYGVLVVILVANIIMRWRAGQTRLWHMHDGYAVPSSAMLYCIFMLGYVVVNFAVMERLIGIFNGDGTYKWLWFLRGFSWAWVALGAVAQVAGVGIATSFNLRPAQLSTPSHRFVHPAIFNGGCIAFVLVVAGLFIFAASWMEHTCRPQFAAFRRAASVAVKAQEGMAAGVPINADVIRAWYGALLEMEASECLSVSMGVYWGFLGWLVLMLFTDIVCATVLTRKIRAQVKILQRSAQRLGRLETKGTLPASFGSKNTAEVLRPKFSASSSRSLERVGSPASIEKNLFAPPTLASIEHIPLENMGLPSRNEASARTRERLEERAAALRVGLSNLMAQSALLIFAVACFLGIDILILVVRIRAQSDPLYAAIVNLFNSWIFVFTGGPASALLLIASLDGQRSSFAGVPIRIVPPAPSSLTASVPASFQEDDESGDAQSIAYPAYGGHAYHGGTRSVLESDNGHTFTSGPMASRQASFALARKSSFTAVSEGHSLASREFAEPSNPPLSPAYSHSPPPRTWAVR